MTNHEDKRLPRPTPLTQPWWDACARGQLLIQHCAACGHFQFYPRSACADCGTGSPDWHQAKGHGEVISFTIIRHPVSSAYAQDIPFAIALVRLEEGPVMMTSLTDCDPESVRIGQPVEVCFEQWTTDITMPKFRPA